VRKGDVIPTVAIVIAANGERRKRGDLNSEVLSQQVINKVCTVVRSFERAMVVRFLPKDLPIAINLVRPTRDVDEVVALLETARSRCHAHGLNKRATPICEREGRRFTRQCSW
jgi:hypothetical protein